MKTNKINKKAEEASFDYQRELGMNDSVSDEHIVARRMGFYDGFKAGVEWQKKEDKETIEVAEDHAFLGGSVWQKEQMMKNAHETIMQLDELQDLVPTLPDMAKYGFKVGDKVKVIIIKNETTND